MQSLIGPRILLRPWQESDRAPFAALNADPEVMRHFPSPLSRTESDAVMQRIHDHFAQHGFGMWAVELPGVADFVGFVGLMYPSYTAHFTCPEAPCLEIGWRLARSVWGQGLASEGARRSLQYAFETLAADEVVSLTVPDNIRSRAVMERLGMQHNPAEDFEHPRVPEGHPLRHHVLYRLRRVRWQKLFRNAP